MSSALRVSRYALYTYDWPSRTPNRDRGRSRPILGSATLTTVESRNTMPDPSTAASRIQRLKLNSSLLAPGIIIGSSDLEPRRESTFSHTATPAIDRGNWRCAAALGEFELSFLNGLQRSVNRKVQGSNPCSGANSPF